MSYVQLHVNKQASDCCICYYFLYIIIIAYHIYDPDTAGEIQEWEDYSEEANELVVASSNKYYLKDWKRN